MFEGLPHQPKEGHDEAIRSYLEGKTSPERGGLYRQRVIETAEAIKTRPETLHLLEQVLDKVVNYTDSIYRMETTMQFLRLKKEPDEYRETARLLDEERRRSHNVLIDSLNIFRRNTADVEGLPEGDVFPLVPQGELDSANASTRRLVGDWAVDLEFAYLQNRA